MSLARNGTAATLRIKLRLNCTFDQSRATLLHRVRECIFELTRGTRAHRVDTHTFCQCRSVQRWVFMVEHRCGRSTFSRCADALPFIAENLIPAVCIDHDVDVNISTCLSP